METLLKFRSKSKTPTLPSTPNQDTEINPFDIHDFEEETRRPASRVSSMLNFGKQQNSPVTADSLPFPSPTFGYENHDARAAQNVWHNPNSDQMAETLKVTMMTRGNSEPIPVQYNSNILHILEAYYKQSQELKKKDEELSELRAQLKENMDRVEKLGKEWSTKEAQYKTELKNLEVMVANGVVGLEAVTLARAKSILDRSDSKFEEAIRKIQKGSDDSRIHRSKKMASSFGDDKEVKLSKMFMEKSQQKSSKEQQRGNYNLFSTSDDNMNRVKRTLYASNALSATKDDSKPLPDIPLDEPNDDFQNSDGGRSEESFPETHVRSRTSDSHSRALSYVPGDDSFQWRRQQPQQPVATYPEHRDSDIPKRMDSSSSAVTVIRDDPATTEKESDNRSGKKPDAIVAAALAMAPSKAASEREGK